jgi:hypothetical protein
VRKRGQRASQLTEEGRMSLRTASSEWVICPGCGERHEGCVDWVKSMPHREVCSCGAEMLCWFETETIYYAEALSEPATTAEKKKGKKKDGKKRGKKKQKNKKKRKQ